MLRPRQSCESSENYQSKARLSVLAKASVTEYQRAWRGSRSEGRKADLKSTSPSILSMVAHYVQTTCQEQSPSLRSQRKEHCYVLRMSTWTRSQLVRDMKKGSLIFDIRQ